MNWIDTNTLIAICTCAIGLTQFLFWRYIAKNKAYESEKGKNLATKEDIGEITKEIKSVESKFINETERLKSNLAILTNLQTDISSIERNALVEINKSLFTWLNTVLYFPDYEDINDIEKYDTTLDKLHNIQQQNEIMFELFVDEQNIQAYLNKISLAIFDMHINRKIQISALKKIITGNDTIPSNHSPNKKEKIEDAIDKYNENILKQHEKIVPIIHLFRKQSRNYIYKLLNLG